MYKSYSDSYLMSMTKAQIIDCLRTAEHNFFATEQSFNQQMENVKDWQPVIHAHWIPQFVSRRGLSYLFMCSNCNECTSTNNRVLNCSDKFCKHCGAKMDGKDGEKNGKP